MVKRSISPAPRYPSGELKRPTTRAQIEEAQRKRDLAETATVCAQPHRRWVPEGQRLDQRLESALGRACIALRLAPELYQAGQEYRALYRHWRIAIGVPSGEQTQGTNSCIEPDEGVAQVCWARIKRAEAAMQRSAPSGCLAGRHIAIDDQDLPDGCAGAVSLALYALAVHFGFMPAGRHPFLGPG